MTPNALERLGIYLNNFWLAVQRPLLNSRLTRLFVGEVEDIPDRGFEFLLPNRRKVAQKYYHLLGYVIRFDPTEYADRASVRARLGYGDELLLICATGGLSAGKELLETCGKAHSLLRMELPDRHMVAVCGELFGEEPPLLPPEVELHSYLPDLYQHYAACDLAVVVGGGTTTIELTALRRPFISFPLENQFDQELYVAERLARHRAGIKMRYAETIPESLAQAIRAHIGKAVDWPPIPTGGAQKAAEIIGRLLVGA